MSLSWGRREVPPRASAAARLWLGLATVLAALMGSFAAPPEPPPNAMTPTLKSELQAVLEVEYAGLRDGDAAGYEYAIDPTRPDLVRCMRERFDLVREARVSPATPRIVRIEPYRNTYVRAYVRDGDGVARMYFRRAGVFYNIARPPFQIWRTSWRWYVSEPVRGELGPQRQREVDGIPISYWAADEEIVDAVGAAASAARAYALLQRAVDAPRPFGVRLVPTRELGRDVRCQLAGGTAHQPSGEIDVLLFDERFTSDLRDAAGSLRETLRHEALHWLQHEVVRDLEPGEADWWLIEGYAHRESGTDRGRFPPAGCASPPSYQDLARGVPTSGPSVAGSSDLYAFAARMTDLVFERWGRDGYWALLAEAARTSDDAAYRKVLGISGPELRDEWVAWARTKYCG